MVRRDTSVKTKLFSNGVCIRKFSRHKSGRPEQNVQHFFERPVEETLVGVVVPIYNEQATDLRKTLLSIDMQVNYMRAQRIEITPHVMLVQDGVSKASQSMKKYLRNMFNLDEDQWKREFEIEDNSAPYQTFVLQILNNSSVSYVNVNSGYKSNSPDNRKKHNSHEWFLGESGFMNYYRPKYALCTDCSTLFHKACLLRLIEYMENHPKCGVTTGRQRVMTKEMQGDPDEKTFSVASILRHAQRFDYESSFVCYTGTFSAVGFLPVVPGPCGLYRTDVLLPTKELGGYADSPCEWYFDVVNTDPDKSGMVLGNLRIAEDRVLSYSVVLKSKTESEMGLVPQAVFYFEAETSLKTLVLQRRRWINGTWAGYWYLAIQHPNLIFDAKFIGIFTKLFVWFLLLCQLAIYIVVALAPAIFLGALRLTLSTITDNTDTFLATACWVILVLMYLYFIYHHHLNTYLGYLFNLWLVFSAILSTTSIVSFIVYVVKHRYLLEPKILRLGDVHNTDFTDALTIWIVITILVLPLIIAIIADGRKSIFLMLRSIIPYYLVLPMVVGFFSAYSFSRCWDLTWGNRPTEDDPAHRQAKQKEEDLKTQSATLAAFIAIANIFFFFTQELILSYGSGKWYFAMTIFATTLFQMVIGLLWFSYYRIKFFLTGLWYFATHCGREKKFIYSTYGDEEDDSSEEVDVHTLYYNDNNDSDAEGDDFVNDDDEYVDYYDSDSRAIVLVDGPLQRHMSVSNFALPSIPETVESSSDGYQDDISSPAFSLSPSPSPPALIYDPITTSSNNNNNNNNGRPSTGGSKLSISSSGGANGGAKPNAPNKLSLSGSGSGNRKLSVSIPNSNNPSPNSSPRNALTNSRPFTLRPSLPANLHALSLSGSQYQSPSTAGAHPIISRRNTGLDPAGPIRGKASLDAFSAGDRPKLMRSVNSSYGVSFASPPSVTISPSLSASSSTVTSTTSSSSSGAPHRVVQHARIRSTSLPPLPPSFFVPPPPNSPPLPSALRQSSGKQ